MLSIVVPVFNEEESLRPFYAEVVGAVVKLSKSYEIVFVDDGSTDSSLALLKSFVRKNKHVRIFSLRRNSGKSEALMLGFQKAKGEILVTLDADLQDKPAEIHKLLRKQKEGFDVVSGWRKDRRDKTKMVFISKIFNAIVSRFFHLKLHDYNCGLKVYTKEAAKSLRLYGGLHRFIPLLAYENGFSVAEVPIIHAKRRFGKSKYGFSKLWKDLPDMLTMFFLVKYSKRPLHFFGMIGTLFFIVGIVILVYLTIQHFQGYAIFDRPILFLGMLLVLASLQILFTGFLADLLINIAHENRMKREEKEDYLLRFSTR